MQKIRASSVESALRTAIRRRSWSTVLMFALMAGLYLYQQHYSPQANLFTGNAEIHDGDTLTVGGVKFRLYGIDAPELAQTCLRNKINWDCGVEAKRHLFGLIGNRQVVCLHKGTSFDRQVAICKAGDRELAREMVLSGYARAYEEYSKAYMEDEAQARSRKAGIWAGTFQNPWEWRKAKKE